MRNISLLTVDAAGTLLTPWPSVGAIYAQTARAKGIKVTDQDLDSRFGHAFAEAQNATDTLQGNEKEFWKKVVALTFQPFMDGRSIDSLFEELWDLFARGDPWRLARGAETTLSTLCERGYRLAILSNNDSRLRTVLKDLQVDHLFEHLFISSELGFEKPDSQIFKAVETKMLIPPEEIMHIGDSYSRDYMGAKIAGWTPLLYDSDSGEDDHISHFSKLLDLLP